MSYVRKYLNKGEQVDIEITVGLDKRMVKARVMEYLGNGQYVVETANNNRYIREFRNV